MKEKTKKLIRFILEVSITIALAVIPRIGRDSSNNTAQDNFESIIFALALFILAWVWIRLFPFIQKKIFLPFVSFVLSCVGIVAVSNIFLIIEQRFPEPMHQMIIIALVAAVLLIIDIKNTFFSKEQTDDIQDYLNN